MFKNPWTLFCVALTFIILFMLGVWQLHRLGEKTHFFAALEKSLSHDAKTLAEAEENPLYSKVKLTGHFIGDKNIYLYGRVENNPKKDAYYLVSPFQTTEGKVILVARGWFLQTDKDKISDIKNTINQEITGLIFNAEHKGFFIPKNDFNKNIWFTLNIADAEKFLGVNKLENFYLIQTSNDLPKFLNHINTDRLLKIRNNHLEYAITWFGLAISLIVIYLIYSRGIV